MKGWKEVNSAWDIETQASFICGRASDIAGLLFKLRYVALPTYILSYPSRFNVFAVVTSPFFWGVGGTLFFFFSKKKKNCCRRFQTYLGNDLNQFSSTDEYENSDLSFCFLWTLSCPHWAGWPSHSLREKCVLFVVLLWGFFKSIQVAALFCPKGLTWLTSVLNF